MQKDIRGGRKETVKMELRDYGPGDEREIVRILSACHGGEWQNEDYWRWKHVDCPGFTSHNVVTAYADNKMVGCFHEAVLPLRLEAGLDLPICFDGDFAVLPDHRGKRIPIQANDLINSRLLERGALLRVGFPSTELNEGFYHKYFGYIILPSTTAKFIKINNLMRLQRKVETFGIKLLGQSWLRRALNRIPLVVDIQVDNFPPCHIEFTEQAFRLCNNVAPQSDLQILVPYSVLVAFIKGPLPFVKLAFFNFLRGRLRIRGLLRNGPRLLARHWFGITRRKSKGGS